jgi:hypothetical protein
MKKTNMMPFNVFIRVYRVNVACHFTVQDNKTC